MRLQYKAVGVLAVFMLVLASLGCRVTWGSSVANTPTQVLATPEELPTLANTPQQIQEAARATVTALRSLNVRSEPGDNNEVIGALYAGDEISLTGECDSGWAQIDWEGSTAWVHADYLSDNLCTQ